jgi:phosphoadenosine phosphosulfate reductase
MQQTIFGNTFEDIAISRIQKHEPEEGYFLAFSGGKDSIVIYDLARKSKVDFSPFYKITTVDPPEIIHFIRKHYPDVKFIKPKYTMYQLIIKKHYPPTRKVRYCCHYLKEMAPKGTTILGVRWGESTKRVGRPVHQENYSGKGKNFLNPIVEWADKDVWEYIKTNNLIYPNLYDKGFKRIGCVGCPLATKKQRILELEMFPKIKEGYLRAFKKMLDNYEDYSEKNTWKTPEDVMNWWVYDQ